MRCDIKINEKDILIKLNLLTLNKTIRKNN